MEAIATTRNRRLDMRCIAIFSAFSVRQKIAQMRSATEVRYGKSERTPVRRSSCAISPLRTHPGLVLPKSCSHTPKTMKAPMTSPIFAFAALAALVLTFIPLREVRAEGFVHADHQQIVDGNGKPLLLRGIGLGGWMVQEGYM